MRDMNRKGKRIYVQERLTARVLQRCRIIKSADNTKTLYYDPVRRRFIELREKNQEEDQRYYPPLVAKRISLVDTLVVWSKVRVKVQVVYDRESDQIISNIQRLD